MFNLRLRPAIAFVLLLGFLIPVIVASQLTLLDQKHVLMEELRKEHTRRLEILSIGLQEPVWSLVPEAGLPLIKAIMADTRIVSIVVKSDEGIFIEKHSPFLPPSERVLTQETKILYHGKEIGSVAVALDTSQLEKTFALQSTRYLTIILVPFMLSTIVLFFLLRRKIIKPIELLITQFEDLASKKLDKQFIWKQRDEIGLLGRSLETTRQSLHMVFNDLEAAKDQAIIYSNELEKSNSQLKTQISERIKIEQELRIHKEQLENKVQQRTLELQQTNQNLLKEIKERIKGEKERREIEERLHRAEKMEALGLMASGVAHDLNNILAGIVSYPEILLLKMDKQHELYKPLDAIRAAGMRAASVVSDLLTIARNAATVRTPYNLNELVKEYFSTTECSQLLAIAGKIQIEFLLEAKKSNLLCSPVHVRKCLMNLVINSVEAIGRGNPGTITVSTYNTTEIEGSDRQGEQIEYVVLSIADTGSGIAAKDVEHIFEPFYSTKQMGKSGSGLGLAVVWSAMQEHHGKVVVDSDTNGTCFRLFFPHARDNELVQAYEGKEQYVNGNNETVLVVDDEPLLLTIAREMLKELGYRVVAVPSGEKAIEYLLTGTAELVMLDMVMEPGINGRQTYEKMIQINPGQKALIVSGFAINDDIQAALDMGIRGFLKKPYTIYELSEAIRRVNESGTEMNRGAKQ